MNVAVLKRNVAEQMPRRHPRLRKLLIAVGILIALGVIQTLPVFIVQPLGAKEYRSANALVIYAPGDEAGAKEVFDLVNSSIAEIKAKMRFELNQPLKITENGMTFGNFGGYAYSYSYVEFLDKTCGWSRVLEYTAGGKSYEAVFGKSEQALYDEWAQHLKG